MPETSINYSFEITQVESEIIGTPESDFNINTPKFPVELFLSQNRANENQDPIAMITGQEWAWSGVKRELAAWAAANEGQTIPKGDVTVASSKNNAEGTEAPTGYHYISLKQGSNTIELLVHDASGDIALDDMTLNGVKVSGEFADPFVNKIYHELEKMINNFDAAATPLTTPEEVPAVEESSASPIPDAETEANTPEVETTTSYTVLLESIANNNLLEFVANNQILELSELASTTTPDSPPEYQIYADSILSSVRELSSSPKFSSGKFIYLGGNVEELIAAFEGSTPEEKSTNLSVWATALTGYIKVSAEGQIVIDDDNDTQYLISDSGEITQLTVPLQDLKVIPLNTQEGRKTMLRGLQAILGGKYEPDEIQSWMESGVEE